MSLKVYFCGSIRGGMQDTPLYHRIIQKIGTYGKVLTEFVGDVTYLSKEKKSDKEIHDRDVSMLTECDAVVAEVTIPSHGVGYELGRAVAMGKPILCIYRPSPDKRLSAMIGGAHNGTTFIVKEYEESQVDEILKEFLGNMKN